jgi:UDPglucose--hexose-1-phosphate uridylyltransferase
MSIVELNENSHRRYNPLTDEWIQVSPHRSKRPWQGHVEKTEHQEMPAYDPTCYLCPGNKRSNGEHNPPYTGTFSFVNDFAAIVPGVKEVSYFEGVLVGRSERGLCKVLCFSPDHSKTMAEMTTDEVTTVVNLWVDEFREMSGLPYINHIQIFENKGSVMGCSNPHPHGQIWAQESIPMEAAKKQRQQALHYKTAGETLLYTYLKTEIKLRERVVFENDGFVIVVPFWATWPFETMIIPKRPMADITSMTLRERREFAEALQSITARYDNLFETSFPYSSGIHQAPTDGADHPEWHWHMTFFPPLLRSATVKKFMVGYEMFANPQRDVTPEYAAGILRNLSSVHYKKKDATVGVSSIL